MFGKFNDLIVIVCLMQLCVRNVADLCTRCRWPYHIRVGCYGSERPFIDQSSERFSVFCMEYPCGECRKEVGEDDRAIQYEGECQSWYHCACIGIGDDEYDHLSSSEDSWSCSL